MSTIGAAEMGTSFPCVPGVVRACPERCACNDIVRFRATGWRDWSSRLYCTMLACDEPATNSREQRILPLLLSSPSAVLLSGWGRRYRRPVIEGYLL